MRERAIKDRVFAIARIYYSNQKGMDARKAMMFAWRDFREERSIDIDNASRKAIDAIKWGGSIPKGVRERGV